MKGPLTAAVALLATGISGWQVSSIATVVSPPSKPIGLDAHESHAAASLLGQFRTSSSSWLWLKIDLYLHNGVEMRALTVNEKRRGQTAIKDGDGWHQAIGDDEASTTLIPDASRDFRGIFGDIERAVNAYKPMQGHVHNDPRTALPLFRLMTWLDPSFLPGWTTGAMVIASERTDPAYDSAVAFLNSGLVEIPESIAIRTSLAQLMIGRKREIDQAIPVLEAAIKLAKKYGKSLPESELESAVDAFRWLCLCYSDKGLTMEAIKTANEGMDIFGEDAVLARMANPSPSLLLPIEKVRPSDTSEQPRIPYREHEHKHSSSRQHDH